MYLIIARIKNNNIIAGYRVLDTLKMGRAGAIVDVDREKLLASIRKGSIRLENAVVDDEARDLKGTNGSIDRYAELSVNNEVIGTKAPLVIACRVEPSNGFIIVDCMGRVAKLTEDEAVTKCKELGIANGKLVERDGKTVISSISGEYPTMKEQVAPKIEVKFLTMSDSDSVEVLINKIAEHVKNPKMALIGKLNDEKSDDLIKGVVNKFKLTEAVAKKDYNKAKDIIETVVTKYMPAMSKVCNKKAVIKNSVGLKAVYKDVCSGDMSLLDRAIKGMEKGVRLGDLK
jgi:hypothetical protein